MATYDDLMVDIGNAPNDDHGDPLRTAFDKINQRFAELRVFLNNRGDWAPNTAYTANPNRDWVIVNGVGYLATSNHTSGATFAADLAAGKWVEADALLAIQEAQAASDAVDTLRDDLASTAAGKGAALVGFKQIGTGAVARTAQDKMRETVSVKDFDGADPTGVADSYAAFAAAIASLPSDGGKITVGPGIWKLATEPTWGTKSLHWDIDPSATFTGAGTGFGKFPYMETNPAQLAVGPFIQSHTSTKSAHPNGGVAAFQVEMLQPADYGAGQSVAIYAGAKGSSSDPAANVWAVNALIAVESTAAGVYQCMEVDVDTNSAAALVKGISISGGGAANPDVGIEITRLTGIWDRGLHILNAQDAIVVNPIVNGRGIVLGSPVGPVNTAISSIQFANNADTIFLQRATDTAPSGFLFRAVNAANNSNIILIDVLGNITTSGLMRATNFRTSSAALPAEANTLSIGSGISATAIAGTNGAVPAQVAAYLEVYHGANKYRIPLFN